MNSRIVLALFGAALALGGCQPDLKMADRSGAVPSRDLQSCAAAGGTIQSRGKLGRPLCVHPYSDAGKSCSGKSDCRGRCLANEGPVGLPKLGDTTGGHCQADDHLFGCYAEVEGGRAKGGICVD